MSKTLFLVRHAEAESSGAGQKDHDRVLTNTGFADALRMGKKLFDKGIKLDKIISSSATRAAVTAELLSEQLKFPVSEIEFDKEIFEASVRSLLNYVNQASSDYNSLMIVGHNPVISYFAEYITGEQIGSIPTTGVAQIVFEIGKWDEVSSGNGKLNFLETPYKDRME